MHCTLPVHSLGNLSFYNALLCMILVYYLGKKFSYKLGYKLITSKRLKLQSCAKSQIVGNSFALLYLMSFFKIGLELIEILPPEDDRVFL